HPGRAGAIVVAAPADDRGVAAKRDGGALGGGSNGAAADQLVSLLGPHSAAGGEHPRRADIIIVARTAYDGAAAVAGQCDRLALARGSNRAGSDQLALLRPTKPTPVDPHPRGAGTVVVERPAHDGRIAAAG